MVKRRNDNKQLSVLPMFVGIGVCLVAGTLGSAITTSALSSWYQTLVKPPINPPNWVFPLVWTNLYVLMGISMGLVWQTTKSTVIRDKAVWLFGIQLFFNILWSFLFFGFHSPMLAFGEIVVLWISIVLTLRSFFAISKLAGYLLIPYIAWVSFALFLNLWIVLLNS